MAELFKTKPERIINIKNEILSEVDHNRPKMPRDKNKSFLDAISIGVKKYPKSCFQVMMNKAQED